MGAVLGSDVGLNKGNEVKKIKNKPNPEALGLLVVGERARAVLGGLPGLRAREVNVSAVAPGSWTP